MEGGNSLGRGAARLRRLQRVQTTALQRVQTLAQHVADAALATAATARHRRGEPATAHARHPEARRCCCLGLEPGAHVSLFELAALAAAVALDDAPGLVRLATLPVRLLEAVPPVAHRVVRAAGHLLRDEGPAATARPHALQDEAVLRGRPRLDLRGRGGVRDDGVTGGTWGYGERGVGSGQTACAYPHAMQCAM